MIHALEGALSTSFPSPGRRRRSQLQNGVRAAVEEGEDEQAGHGTLRSTALVVVPLTLAATAPLLGITPVIRVGRILFGGLLFTALAIGFWALVRFRPRREDGGPWRVPTDGRPLFVHVAEGVAEEKTHWLRGALLSMLCLLLLDVYASYKQAIPRLGRYRWDSVFAGLDRAVHLGRDPWVLLDPFFAWAPAIHLLDWVYWAWYPATMGLIALVCFSRRPRVRFQALLTFYLSWIVLGIVLATIFASGGPVYFGHFSPDATNPYLDLTARLGTLDLLALRGHQGLLRGFLEQGDPWISGISAMPSMHVAMAALTVLVARHHGRVFGLLAGAYAFLILVGSVALAWHYAIDGYASVALVSAIWWASGRVAGP